MKQLQEFSLINMHARMREDTLVNIGSSFINHESLEKLDLSNNNLANFDSIIKLLHGNKKIKAINIRGSSMDVNQLQLIWLGLRQNTSLVQLEYQKENVVFAFDTLNAVEIEMILNQQINEIIIPKVPMNVNSD